MHIMAKPSALAAALEAKHATDWGGLYARGELRTDLSWVTEAGLRVRW